MKVDDIVIQALSDLDKCDTLIQLPNEVIALVDKQKKIQKEILNLNDSTLDEFKKIKIKELNEVDTLLFENEVYRLYLMQLNILKQSNYMIDLKLKQFKEKNGIKI